MAENPLPPKLQAMEPPTLEELVKKVGISLHLLDQKCSDDHLRSISLFLDWRSVAPHLGLSERDIEAIEFDKKTEDERRLAVLQKWKRKYGYKATLKRLVAVLLAVGNADDAEQVCCLLPTPAGDHQQSSLVTAAEANICSTVVEPSKVSIQLSESDIDTEVRELEDDFLTVVRKAARDLRAVELSDVKVCVTQLPVSVKYQHLHFLEHSRSAIMDATSVDAILAILGRYWDYLNCGLLNEVVHQLGSGEIKQLMEQYMEKLREFRMKTKLGDFIDKTTKNIPPHFTAFVTEMGEDWRDRTLEDLQNFRKQLAHSMHLKEYAMHFDSVVTGSIAVTWALHSSLPAITDILQSAFQLLEKKYCILRMGLHQLSIPPAPQAFDMITALLRAGVPHIVEQILQSLDMKSLVKSEQVSSMWRDVIENLRIWKHTIDHSVNSNPLWRDVFKRRGWNKYLCMPPVEQISRRFYRQLHHSASKDINSLEANWRRGHHTLTRVETGSGVQCLQYDDNKMVTGHEDSTIKIWDRSTLSLQLLKVLKGHNYAVLCLQYNEEVVISGSYDHKIKVWDIQTGQVIKEILHHKGSVYSLKFTTNTLVTGSSDHTVVVWSIKSPNDITLRMILPGHKYPVYAVDLNETYIISGSIDKTVKVWDSSTGALVRTLGGHSAWINCVQLQGRHIISGCDDKTIRVWNIDTGECIRVLHGHNGYVLNIAVDNKRILSGSRDKTIKVWDLAAALNPGSSSDALCITTLEHTGYVYGLQFDAVQVISGSHDGTLLTYDFLDPTPPILST